MDLIGDMALLGMPIRGHILAARSGHKTNVELVKKLRQIQLKHELKKKYQKDHNKDLVFDINAIMRIIPHRYPFLLVDKIIDLKPGESITGIKNVTINEPFFQWTFSRPLSHHARRVDRGGNGPDRRHHPDAPDG